MMTGIRLGVAALLVLVTGCGRISPATEAELDQVLTACDVEFRNVRPDPKNSRLLLYTIQESEPARLAKFDCVAEKLEAMNIAANGQSITTESPAN